MEAEETTETNQTLDEDNFTVLKDYTIRGPSKANEILPDWVTHSVKVDDSLEKSKKLSKIPEISENLKNLLKVNFKKLFPVQHSVIPAIIKSQEDKILRPHDICVCAPTGSGKTLAYVIPILQLLSEKGKVEGPRAIIVLPVRDLALQVFNVFNGFAKTLDIKCTLITGQKNLSKEKEDLLKEENGYTYNKADIIICTPGRLVDHIRNTKELNFSYLQYLVIDEADRVLKEHKHDWYTVLTQSIDISKGYSACRNVMKNILSCFIHDDRIYVQKILLSATLTRDPHLLHHFDLHYPRLFVVGGHLNNTMDLSDNYSAPKTLDDNYVVCPQDYMKIIFIIDLVRRQKMSKILCFTNTRDSAARLHLLLSEFKDIRSSYISCQLHPKIRGKLRHDFERGDIDVLVTVDSMGRGMDLEGVKCVIQYDTASDVNTHIHRVGRTARGGQKGIAYALVSEKHVFYLKKSLASCNRTLKNHKFNKGKCYKYMAEYNAALSKLQNNATEVKVIEKMEKK